MKRVLFYSIAIVLVIAVIYFYEHRAAYPIISEWLPVRSSGGVVLPVPGQKMAWQRVDQSSSGFNLEMPGEPKRITVQATTEAGTNEPINMLIVKPEADRSYAIAWADKPPVARMNDLVPDRTLDQARDGALTRTSTTLVNETRTNPQGFPGRDIVSHNVGGGILDTRFIYAGPRLYMLIAASPSASARHEDEVNHFFNSFTISSNTQIPETLPAATGR